MVSIGHMLVQSSNIVIIVVEVIINYQHIYKLLKLLLCGLVSVFFINISHHHFGLDPVPYNRHCQVLQYASKS